MKFRVRRRALVPAISAVAIALIAVAGFTTSAAGHGTFHGWADSHRIKDNTIRSIDVRNEGLGLRDFNQFTQDAIAAGGGGGVAEVNRVSADGTLTNNDQELTVTATCAADEGVVGGGYTNPNGATLGEVIIDHKARTWSVTFTNPTSTDRAVSAIAFCVPFAG